MSAPRFWSRQCLWASWWLGGGRSPQEALSRPHGEGRKGRNRGGPRGGPSPLGSPLGPDLGETRPHSPHPAKTLWQQESGHPVPPPRRLLDWPPGSPSLCLLSSCFPRHVSSGPPRRAAARSQRGARRQVGAPCPMLILTLALPTEVWGFTSDLHQSPRGDPGRCARPGFPRVPPACRSVFPRLLSSQVRAGTAQNKHPSCLQAQSCGARGSGSSSSSRTWAPVGLRFLERRAGRQAVPAQECFPGPQPGFLLWGRLRREGDRRALGKSSGGFGAQDPGFCADSLPPLPREIGRAHV